MTATVNTRDRILGPDTKIEKTDLPAGIRSACVEEDGVAVILVDGNATPADQMILGLEERLALIRRRCEREGRCPKRALLKAGWDVGVYLAVIVVTVLTGTVRATLTAVGVPAPARVVAYLGVGFGLALGGIAAFCQLMPFLPNLW